MKRSIIIALMLSIMSFSASAIPNTFYQSTGSHAGYIGFPYGLDMQGRDIFNINQLCLSADCRSIWPSGGNGSAGISWINGGDGLLGGNISVSGEFSANLSYFTDYFYNKTNPNGYISSYMETDPYWALNYSAFNSSWSATFNSTYDAKPNSTFNATYDAKVSYNASWNETRAGVLFHPLNKLNSAWTGTLDWNNISLRSLNIAWTGFLGWGNLTGYDFNKAWSNKLGMGNLTLDLNQAWTNKIGIYNLTGFPNSTTKTCSGTDKFSAYDNSTGAFTCSSDQTGGGGSGANVTTTSCSVGKMVVAINNNTGIVTCASTNASTGTAFYAYSAIKSNVTSNSVGLINVTNLTLALPAQGQFEIECLITESSNLATTGIRNRIYVGGSANTQVSVRYMSSATAISLCTGKTSSTDCNATSSAAVQGLIREIFVYTNQTSGGNFSIGLASEISNSVVTFLPPSYCRMVMMP